MLKIFFYDFLCYIGWSRIVVHPTDYTPRCSNIAAQIVKK